VVKSALAILNLLPRACYIAGGTECVSERDWENWLFVTVNCRYLCLQASIVRCSWWSLGEAWYIWGNPDTLLCSLWIHFQWLLWGLPPPGFKEGT
jgi:hypothetical protein